MECEVKVECMFEHMHASKHSRVFKTLIEDYCNGPLYSHCERRKRILLKLADLPDSLLPTGQDAPHFDKLR